MWINPNKNLDRKRDPRPPYGKWLAIGNDWHKAIIGYGKQLATGFATHVCKGGECIPKASNHCGRHPEPGGVDTPTLHPRRHPRSFPCLSLSLSLFCLSRGSGDGGAGLAFLGIDTMLGWARLGGMNKQKDSPCATHPEIPDTTLRRYARSYLYLLTVDRAAALTYLEMLDEDFGPIAGDAVLSVARSLS